VIDASPVWSRVRDKEIKVDHFCFYDWMMGEVEEVLAVVGSITL